MDIFDSTAWLVRYKKATTKGNGYAIKAARKVISDGTMQACEKKAYRLADGTLCSIELHPALKCTRYDFAANPSDLSHIPYLARTNRIVVLSKDCLDAEMDLRNSQGLNPCVLNMANAITPGGGWLAGAGAQEESLFRRSNYYQMPHKSYYPLPEFGGVYTSHVSVFRSSEATGYVMLNKPYFVAFVAVAAYDKPTLVNDADGEEVLTPEAYNGTVRKIRAICDMALMNGHDSIVLSAFGCGAFRNPPRSIAAAFRQVLCNDADFVGRFRLVVFAILDDHNARGDGNFAPFRDAFKTE